MSPVLLNSPSALCALTVVLNAPQLTKGCDLAGFFVDVLLCQHPPTHWLFLCDCRVSVTTDLVHIAVLSDCNSKLPGALGLMCDAEDCDKCVVAHIDDTLTALKDPGSF